MKLKNKIKIELQRLLLIVCAFVKWKLVDVFNQISNIFKRWKPFLWFVKKFEWETKCTLSLFVYMAIEFVLPDSKWHKLSNEKKNNKNFHCAHLNSVLYAFEVSEIGRQIKQQRNSIYIHSESGIEKESKRFENKTCQKYSHQQIKFV